MSPAAATHRSQAQQATELRAQFLRETVRRDDWFVALARLVDADTEQTETGVGRDCKISGVADEGELLPNLCYRFFGHWESHPKFGKQFKVKTFVPDVPAGRDAITAYLKQAPGVGPARANELWKAFGSDAVRICREHPEVASQRVKGLTPAQADEISAYLRERAALEGVSIEMLDLLEGRGFPKSTSREAVKQWGNLAPEFLRRNPYLLLRFRGCGFGRCDAMYLDLGLPPERLKRQTLCAWYGISSDTEGHTWLPFAKVAQIIRAKVGGAKVREGQAIALGIRAGILSLRRDARGRVWLADARRAKAEEKLAELVSAAIEESEDGTSWPTISEDPEVKGNLTAHQQERLTAALRGRLSILGGSPGTGKTYTAARLMKELIASYGSDAVAICAPTGKAAVRCTEAMAEYELDLRATTIHSLLKVGRVDGGQFTFRHGPRSPLPHKFVVVDETSMADVPLLASLLAARNRGTHVLLVGDVNQLPPVGYGAPLRDLIDAGLPYGELREIKRNAGTIVRACAQIRDGLPFDVDPLDKLDPTPSDPTKVPRNLALIEATKDGAPGRILQLLRDLQKEAREHEGPLNATGEPFDPIWDCQVVVAVNARSNLSRKELNKLLQDELNPAGQGCQGSPFRVGDKVIQLKNGTLPLHAPSFSGETVFVANGEFGEVLAAEPKKTVVRFSNPLRVVAIPRGLAKPNDKASAGDENPDASTTGCDLELGYAATCHKMQGSDAPTVIVCLDEYPGASGKFGVCKREWLYTAISRAKRVCYLVGRMATARGICSRQALPDRKTFLSERIREALLWSGVAAASPAPAVEFATTEPAEMPW